MATIDLSKLTPAQREQVEQNALKIGAELLGVTPERIKEFYDLSEEENPDKDDDWRRDDVVGKYKRFYRKTRRWEGAVDAVWPSIKPYIEKAVDAVLDSKEEIPDRPQ